jgi:hypothetical protein
MLYGVTAQFLPEQRRLAQMITRAKTSTKLTQAQLAEELDTKLRSIRFALLGIFLVLLVGLSSDSCRDEALLLPGVRCSSY